MNKRNLAQRVLLSFIFVALMWGTFWVTTQAHVWPIRLDEQALLQHWFGHALEALPHTGFWARFWAGMLEAYAELIVRFVYMGLNGGLAMVLLNLLPLLLTAGISSVFFKRHLLEPEVSLTVEHKG